MHDFVYSWTDSKNYRVADVFFNSNSYIYLLFRDIVSGVESHSPQWPGIDTGMKWGFKTEYTVKLTVNGGLTELSIDNSTLSISNLRIFQENLV